MLGLLVFIFVVVNLPWILGGLMSLFAGILPFIIILMIIGAIFENSSKK